MKDRWINYRLVLKWIIPIGVLLILISYQLAFKKTWQSYQGYRQLDNLGQSDEAISISPAYSARRDVAVEKLYKRYQLDSLKWKNRLWDQCAVYAQRLDCSVQGFPAWKHINYGDKSLISQDVVFRGSFHNLLKLQHTLDTIHGLGLIAGSSVSRNDREKQTTLRLQLLGMQSEKQ